MKIWHRRGGSVNGLRQMVAAAAILWWGVVPAVAQEQSGADLQAEIAALREDVQRLRAELNELRAELAGGYRLLGTARVSAPAAPPASAAAISGSAQDAQASLEMLQTQVSELAQTKVGTESRLPLRVFGTIHSHLFANSGDANWLDNPNLIGAPFADGRSGTFSAALRQSRLGLVADGPMVGGFRSSANVAVDFLGGIPGFQTGQTMGLPRLLVAFARLETDRTAFVLGQDHVVLAPRDPTSLAAFAFPLLFRSGNLYLRAPQVRAEHSLSPHLRVTGGIVAPIGGDVPGEDYRFVPPALGGERSRRPGLQSRVAFTGGDPDAQRSGEFGVSAHYGWERRGAVLESSWAAAVDFGVRRDRIGAAGEVFVGDNLDAFGGALGLDARAAGGWGELQFYPSERLTMTAGAGTDRLRNPAAAVRRRNRTAFASAIFAITPELQTSLEYRLLGMLPGGGGERRNHHVDWVFAYKF